MPEQTRSELPREFVEFHEANGFPFCDTCTLPAVWSEFHGWRHSTPEHKFGVPSHLDQSGHKVTAKSWWDDKPEWAARNTYATEETESRG